MARMERRVLDYLKPLPHECVAVVDETPVYDEATRLDRIARNLPLYVLHPAPVAPIVAEPPRTTRINLPEVVAATHIIRDADCHVLTVMQRKRYRIVCTKRRVLPDGRTRPYGYDERVDLPGYRFDAQSSEPPRRYTTSLNHRFGAPSGEPPVKMYRFDADGASTSEWPD